MDEEEEGLKFRIPSEEEHLLSGGRIQKSQSSTTVLEIKEDWTEKLDDWINKWQEKTGYYGKQPKGARMAREFLGSDLMLPIEHNVEAITMVLRYMSSETSESSIALAAKLIYGLTTAKSVTVQEISYLEEGPVDYPEEEA